MGGAGGWSCLQRRRIFKIVEYGLRISPTNEVLIDESIIGWKEYEMEVVRDKTTMQLLFVQLKILINGCSHWRFNYCSARLTLTDKEYQKCAMLQLQFCAKLALKLAVQMCNLQLIQMMEDWW